MGRLRLALFCFTLAGFFISQAMSEDSKTDPAEVNVVKRVETEVPTKGSAGSGRAESPEPESAGEDGTAVAEAPEIRRLGKHHHSSDKSVAGGGVILGGLVTAVFAAVFCYIRVTRRRDGDPQQLPATASGKS